MLNYIKLSNFKCYLDQEFKFEPLTVFCGSNSVGKSTAIQAIAIPFQSRFDRRVSLNGELVSLGVREDLHNRNVLDDELKIELKHSEISHRFVWGYSDLSSDPRAHEIEAVDSNVQASATIISEYADKGFQFLEAERFGPRNNFKLRQSTAFPNWLGARGEYTWETIFDLVNKQRLRLSDDDARNHPNNAGNRSVHANIELWMSEISEGFHVDPNVQEDADVSYSTYSSSSMSLVKPINMGFGLTYSLSVVAALMSTKPGGLVIIENPEAHLHPKGQSYLGRLIALSAEAGVQVVIETHSDHIINGIRLMVRVKSVEHKKVKIYYISADDEKQVTPIEINVNGQMTEWPKGFFDQQAIDMEQLMQGRLKDEN
tara:strand:+ start:5470 stop:6585 length:1116 start_codon:yes stop_codon:yes gene_type:complete